MQNNVSYYKLLLELSVSQTPRRLQKKRRNIKKSHAINRIKNRKFENYSLNLNDNDNSKPVLLSLLTSTVQNTMVDISTSKTVKKFEVPWLQKKIDAIERVRNGESKAGVSRDIGVPESTLRGWCKAEEKIRIQLRTLKTKECMTSNSENGNNNRLKSLPPLVSANQNTRMEMKSISAQRSSEEPLDSDPKTSKIGQHFDIRHIQSML